MSPYEKPPLNFNRYIPGLSHEDLSPQTRSKENSLQNDGVTQVAQRQFGSIQAIQTNPPSYSSSLAVPIPPGRDLAISPPGSLAETLTGCPQNSSVKRISPRSLAQSHPQPATSPTKYPKIVGFAPKISRKLHPAPETTSDLFTQAVNTHLPPTCPPLTKKPLHVAPQTRDLNELHAAPVSRQNRSEPFKPGHIDLSQVVRR